MLELGVHACAFDVDSSVVEQAILSPCLVGVPFERRKQRHSPESRRRWRPRVRQERLLGLLLVSYIALKTRLHFIQLYAIV